MKIMLATAGPSGLNLGQRATLSTLNGENSSDYTGLAAAAIGVS